MNHLARAATPNQRETMIMQAENRNASEVSHFVEIMKTSKKRLNSAKLDAHLNKIIDRALAGSRREKGWQCVVETANWKEPSYAKGEYRYTVKLAFTCKPKRER